MLLTFSFLHSKYWKLFLESQKNQHKMPIEPLPSPTRTFFMCCWARCLKEATLCLLRACPMEMWGLDLPLTTSSPLSSHAIKMSSATEPWTTLSRWPVVCVVRKICLKVRWVWEIWRGSWTGIQNFSFVVSVKFECNTTTFRENKKSFYNTSPLKPLTTFPKTSQPNHHS